MVSWIFIVLVLVAIYIIFELIKFKHGIFSILTIILIVLFLLSLFFVFKDRGVDLNNWTGIKNSVKIYFDWFSLAWHNTKAVTGNAISMNWKNQTRS